MNPLGVKGIFEGGGRDNVLISNRGEHCVGDSVLFVVYVANIDVET